MKFLSEIYLTKRFVSREEWVEFIKNISIFNKSLEKWNIIVSIEKNEIRYYIKTSCNLPATIGNLNSFVLKSSDSISIPNIYTSSIYFSKQRTSIIDILEYCNIKNKGDLKFILINFRKLYKDYIDYSVFLYLKRDNLIKLRMPFGIPSKILSIDFDNNRRFFYKSAPKYLDISKSIHLLNSDSKSSILKVDTFPYLQGEFYINQNMYNFDKHSIIVGSSGSGKSKFISLFINNINKNLIFKQKYKIVVIDPHASLENDIGGIGKVIDFKSDEDSVDLFINKGDDVVVSTELLLELLRSLIQDQYNSKLERVLRHSIHLLLINESFNFSNLRKLILEIEYRSELLKNLKDKVPFSVISFFLSDFNDLKTKSYGEAISPIIAFIDEMEMLPVFNKDCLPNNLKQTINDNFLTIFSLDRTKLGDKVTKTISGLIMQQLLTLVQSYSFNEHIIFITDEVSVVENPVLCRFLSEARKYNLSLVLAGQYFNQISDDLKNSIFANVVNYYIFRVSKLDADILVDNFNMKIPLDDTRERKVKILTELNTRECIIRLSSNDILLPAIKAKTLDFKSIPRIKKTVINQKKEEKHTKSINTNFEINNVNLKDILISNSTSRKVVKK